MLSHTERKKRMVQGSHPQGIVNHPCCGDPTGVGDPCHRTDRPRISKSWSKAEEIQNQEQKRASSIGGDQQNPVSTHFRRGLLDPGRGNELGPALAAMRSFILQFATAV